MGAAPSDPASVVLELCRGEGFSLAGVCDAEPTRWPDRLREWVEQGKHGSMDWLARDLGARLDPHRVLDGVRSMVVVADLTTPTDASADAPLPQGRGRVARYARGDDYHRVIKKRLHGVCDRMHEWFPKERFRAVVDTAPVLEREYAQRAGLGWIGKHTLLIHPEKGSHLMLGAILTSMPLNAPPDQPLHKDHCGTCTRCIDACPTQAITPYEVDARRCISYLTIERRAPIDDTLHPAIGHWLVGCDICQDVCPHNRPRPSEDAVRGEYAPRNGSFDLLAVLGWSEDDRRDAFRRSALKRVTLAMMKRNALIVAGNQGEMPADLRARIMEIADDPGEDDLVRLTARSVLRKLGAAG